MPIPEIGQPLPRAADAYVDWEKWLLYVLGNPGHRRDWLAVFGVVDAVELWATVASRVLTAPIEELRGLGPVGVTCRVSMVLTIGERTAAVRTIWHYAHDGAAPRLVTAYPTT